MTGTAQTRTKGLAGQIGAVFSLENLTLLAYAVFIGMFFFNTTTFSISWQQNAWDYIRIVIYVLIFARAVTERRFSKLKVILFALAMGGFLLSRMRNGYQVLADVLILALALQGISLDKIVRTFFITIATLLTFTVAAALAGKIDNLIYTFPVTRRRRISFGIIYPTDFAAYIFFLWLAWCYLRKNLITWIEIGLMCVTSGLLWYFCDTRLDCVCLLGMAAVFTVLKLRWRAVEKDPGKQVLPRWAFRAGVLAMPVAALFITAISSFYNPENTVLRKINSLLSGRLRKGRLAFDQYGINLLGRPVEASGNGGTTLYYMQKDDFFLDSSYLFTLFRYGLVVLGLVILAYLLVTWRAAKNKDALLAAIMVILSVQCMIEHHILEPNMNPFLFAVVAAPAVSLEGARQQKTRTDKRTRRKRLAIPAAVVVISLISVFPFSRPIAGPSSIVYKYEAKKTTKTDYWEHTPRENASDYSQYFYATKSGQGLAVNLTTYGRIPTGSVTLELYDAESEELIATSTITSEDMITSALAAEEEVRAEGDRKNQLLNIPQIDLINFIENGEFEFYFGENAIREGGHYFYKLAHDDGKGNVGFVVGLPAGEYMDALIGSDGNPQALVNPFSLIVSCVSGKIILWMIFSVLMLLIITELILGCTEERQRVSMI